MLTHGTDGKHKVKAHNMLRDSGYSVKRAAGGSAYSEAHADVKQDKKLVQDAVNQHESHDHPGTKHTKLKLKSGGIASNERSHQRLDHKPRLAKGGKPHTKINIMVAPGGHSDGMRPLAGGPVGAGAALPSPAPIAPPQLAGRPPMAPGVAPPMARAGMSPQVLKRGGKAVNGKIGHYDAGAGSGVGREEKAENYRKYKIG